MTNSTKRPLFIALNSTSQGNSENVLYYDANASQEAIYECATARLTAVINLLENLYEFKNIHQDTLSAVTSIAALVLSDVRTLLEEFNPIAQRLRDEHKES